MPCICKYTYISEGLVKNALYLQIYIYFWRFGTECLVSANIHIFLEVWYRIRGVVQNALYLQIYIYFWRFGTELEGWYRMPCICKYTYISGGLVQN